MLRNESSVQQMSEGSLHLEDQPPPTKQGHQRRRSRKRGKGSRQQLAKSLVETHESGASLSSQTAMQGVVVTRKLAVHEAAKREQQVAKSIQRTRQEALIQHKAVLDQLTSEFLDALHGREVSDTQSASEAGLPALPMRAKLATSDTFNPFDPSNPLQGSNPKLLLQNKRMIKQYETTALQKRELVQVLAA